MKKTVKVLVVALVLFAGTFAITGCENKTTGNAKNNDSSSVFGADSVDEKSVNVNAQDAKKDSSSNSRITVAAGEQLKMNVNLTGDKPTINVKIVKADRNNSTQPVVNENVYGINSYTYNIEAGTYDVYFTALDTVSGTINIMVE